MENIFRFYVCLTHFYSERSILNSECSIIHHPPHAVTFSFSFFFLCFFHFLPSLIFWIIYSSLVYRMDQIVYFPFCSFSQLSIVGECELLEGGFSFSCFYFISTFMISKGNNIIDVLHVQINRMKLMRIFFFFLVILFPIFWGKFSIRTLILYFFKCLNSIAPLRASS